MSTCPECGAPTTESVDVECCTECNWGVRYN